MSGIKKISNTDYRKIYGNRDLVDMQDVEPSVEIKKSAHMEIKVTGGVVLKSKVNKNHKNNVSNSCFLLLLAISDTSQIFFVCSFILPEESSNTLLLEN